MHFFTRTDRKRELNRVTLGGKPSWTFCKSITIMFNIKNINSTLIIPCCMYIKQYKISKRWWMWWWIRKLFFCSYIRVYWAFYIIRVFVSVSDMQSLLSHHHIKKTWKITSMRKKNIICLRIIWQMIAIILVLKGGAVLYAYMLCR